MIGISNTGELLLSSSGIKNYIAKQMKGLALAPIILPLSYLMDMIEPGMSDTVMTGMAVADFLGTGDPLALVVTAAMKIWGAFQDEQERHEDNLQPQKDRGTKYGYVREGNTWYPAALNFNLEGEGFIDSTNEMQLNYGPSLYFKKVNIAGVPEFQPFTTGGLNQHKTFLLDKETYDNKDVTGSDGKPVYWSDHMVWPPEVLRRASKTTVDHYDKLRNWYFLSDDEVQGLLSDPENFYMNAEGQMVFTGMQAYEEDSHLDHNPYEEQIDDWRQVFELMKTDQRMTPTELAQFNTTDITKELRDKLSGQGEVVLDASADTINKGGRVQLFAGNSGFESAYQTDPIWGYDTSDQLGFKGLDEDAYYDKLTSESNFYRPGMRENDWLLNDLFKAQVTELLKAQGGD